MGLTLKTVKKNMNIGYITYYRLRLAIASTYDKNLGEIYKKFGHMCEDNQITQEDNDYWDDNCPVYLDTFLMHSDCDGEFSSLESKGIYKVLKGIELKFDDVVDDYLLKSRFKDLLYLLEDGLRVDFD